MGTSSLPPNQDQKKYKQDEETPVNSEKQKKKDDGDRQNKGYQEDQPGHPVRTTGSMRPDQESDLSSRETGPGGENG
jgi:hypothetical protein